MRLLHKDVNEEGHTTVRLSVSTSEDLWHLFNFIHNEDHVVMRSKRKVSKETATGTGAAEMKWVTLSLEVERVEFQPEELEIKAEQKQFCRWRMHAQVRVRRAGPRQVCLPPQPPHVRPS